MSQANKKIIFALFVSLFAVSGLISPQRAFAQFADVIGGPSQIIQTIWQKIEDVYDTVQGIVGAELANRTASMFFDTMAYNVATELATGGSGGKPLFRTRSMRDQLRDAGNAALGDFVGQLTEKGFDDLGINLCDPSVELKLSLTLGLIDEQKPPKPRCDWQKVRRNWENFDDDVQASIIKFELNPVSSGEDNVSDFFRSIISKEESDLGIAFTLNNRLIELQNEAKEVNELNAIECQGYIDKATPITQEIISHCSNIANISEVAWAGAWNDSRQAIVERKYAASNKSLSSILKDAANNFANTFFSKLMKQWIKRGTWSLAINGENDLYENYRNSLIDRLRGGANIRQPRGVDIFKDIVNVNIQSIDEYSFIDDFTICPSQFRNPDNCVMSPAFLQAINNQLTVQQAIDQGIIDGNMPFIPPDDRENHTVSKCYRDNLCYGNLIKLRKANIIPVGWELAALRDSASLQQVINCFEEGSRCDFDTSAEYAVGGNEHNPFYHLVDPDWVLKAPPVRCEAYGYSPFLESPESSNRQQYCADSKVCLNEDSNGECIEDQYAYCTRSENTWNFQGQTCEEEYAGCLTFVSEENGNQSYLQDTLEYCTSDQAGCRRYSQEQDSLGDWALEDIAIDDNDLFLNKQALECEEEDAGCSQYIVMATNIGTNLVYNGSFDDLNGDDFPDDWTQSDGITLSDGISDPTGANNPNNIPLGYDGDRVINGYSGDPYPSTEELSTKVLLQPNTSYVVSIDAAQYDNARNDRARIIVQMCDNQFGCDENTTPADSIDTVGNCYYNVGGHPNNVDLIWYPTDINMQRRSCSFMTNEFVNYAIVNLIGIGGTVAPPDEAAIWFDNLKIEPVSSVGQAATAYSDYGSGATLYMNDDVVMCSADEVGCQGYLPDNGDPMIPAVITQNDLCPAECIGYDTFAEDPNIFDLIEGDNLPEYYNFIPETALSCPDQAIGCEEFTNLDVVAEGGEGREYFTYLRQCVTPNLGANYYTWEGTEVSGYQLVTWSALPSTIDDGTPGNPAFAPCTNMDPQGNTCLDVAFTNNGISELHEAAVCDDPDNDLNCREFFDENGSVFYRLQDRVIFATDNCHDYRRALTDQVYRAVPEESTSCSAAYNGCRSYYGNTSNNVRQVSSDNFEQGTYSPWFGIGAGTADLSNEALSNNGHSLRGQTNNVLIRDMVGSSIQDNKEYVISWWMKSDANLNNVSVFLQAQDFGGNSYSVSFADGSQNSEFQNIEAGRWHYYTASAYIDGLSSVDMTFIDEFELQIQNTSALTGQGLYIDNFTIKELENSFSVVRNSWDTPASCDQPYEGYHLGCQAYTDLNGQDFNLKSFDHLCREEAIGCMAAIDTHNSSSRLAQTFNAGDYSEITVPADETVYIVPDPANYCSSAFKGCTELGLPDRLDPNRFTTEYKINDPDKYDSIMCNADGLNCTEYNTAKGVFYLKDPGSDTCTYQDGLIVDDNKYSGWFKTNTLADPAPLGCADTDGDPYDINGLYDISELILPRDYCSVSDVDNKQLFYFTKDDCEDNGGFWNNYQLAGQCPSSQDLCTSFKDPSDPIACDPKGRNIDFIDFDGYCTDSNFATQALCEGANEVWVLPSQDGYCESERYNNKRDCERAGWDWTPYCNEYFYYDNNNIDDNSCNGLVDKQDGCVLFYDANNWNGEHSQVISLYDSEQTYRDIEFNNIASSPIACDPSFDPNCNLTANRLISVQKDRQCAEWLACKSSTASFDDESKEYKIICDDLDTCTEFQYDADSNTTRCKTWASYDEDTEALTIEKYQSRNTGLRDRMSWSDKEYTGYSIPNMLPVADLTVYNFGDDLDIRSRLVYDVVDSIDGVGPYYLGCVDNSGNSLDGQACSTTSINDEGEYYFRGECKDRVCWVNPMANAVATSTFDLETRTYSVADAPFPSAIEPDGINRLSKYDQANICTNNSDNPNGCELSFKQVTYGNGQQTFYYPNIDDGGISIPKGICTAGVTTQEDSNTKSQVAKTCNFNYECDSLDQNGESRNDGSCALRTEEIVYNNWPGICLEYDLTNTVTQDGSPSYYCNQWYPAQKVKGTSSLYDNYRAAGYFDPNGNDALFCAAAEPYIVNGDRYYCGAFEYSGQAGQCILLMKVPDGARVNVSMMDQYSGLLDRGSWLEADELSVWSGYDTDNPTGKDIIVEAKFGRYADFNPTLNAPLSNYNNFVEVIDTMFDTYDVYNVPGDPTSGRVPIRRFYYDEDVAPSGDASASSYVWLEGVSIRISGGDKDSCPIYIPGNRIEKCPDGWHSVYERCWEGSRHGLSGRWQNGERKCNPLVSNYYVDVNSGPDPYSAPEPAYIGSCSPDCKFTGANILDSNHGRGCLQNSTLAPTYSSILSSYTVSGVFDVAACQAGGVGGNDCNFVNCIQNVAITNAASHYCSVYEGCFNYIVDPNTNGIISSQALHDDAVNCLSDGYYDDDLDLNTPDVAVYGGAPPFDGVGPTEIYDASQYDKCLADNRSLFDRFNFGPINLGDKMLADYCSTCRLSNADGYQTISFGTDCTANDPIDCYQQCKIVTRVDSEGTLSAVRTDIWWRNEKDKARVREAFPWVSWYADPARGYVTSSGPLSNDDEVLYGSIAAYKNETATGYPDNFTRFGAALDLFSASNVVSTRVPYHRVTDEQLTAATFFSYFNQVEPIADAVDRANLEMQDLFYRVYNLDWSATSSTYEFYRTFELAGGNNGNVYAGPDYAPRILAACDDALCDVVDQNGSVIGVENGITVNGKTGGILTGQEGSLFTSVKFFYHAHPDHMPVYSIDADWGDGPSNNFSLNPGKYKNSLPLEYCKPDVDAPGDANPNTPGREPQQMGFAGLERACQAGYKVFYHNYLYDETGAHACDGAPSGAPGTPPKPLIADASCYQPRIRVMDNWRSAWYTVQPFDGWIVVYDE